MTQTLLFRIRSALLLLSAYRPSMQVPYLPGEGEDRIGVSADIEKGRVYVQGSHHWWFDVRDLPLSRA